ncbi:MAG: DMT family transporter [Micrococcales bacterium]|nr:DMT family transporter [Micrococcales bacterium]
MAHAGADLPQERARTAAAAGHPALGLWMALLSAFVFASAGPFGKALMQSGWSPGAVVTGRVGLAALILLPATVHALRGDLALLRRGLPVMAAYGVVAVAGCQLAYMTAVRHLSVGVALLLEYLAPVLLVGFAWARTRRAPSALTVGGVALSMAGLVCVLDLTGAKDVSGVGVLAGLVAALCLSVFFLISAHDTTGLPPIALAGGGLMVGAVGLALCGLLRVVPMAASTRAVQVGALHIPWWLALLELALLAAALAYATGIIAARLLGSTVASFVGLTEVLFAVLIAWLVLGEVPGVLQAIGGLLMLGGVAAVRLDEARRGEPVSSLAPDADLHVASPDRT